MAREPNKIETAEVRVRTTSIVAEYLDDLVREQLYGKSRAEVSEQFIRAEIIRLIDDGKLVKRSV